MINLAPADMHKKGSGYDLPIALGIIAASAQRDLPLLDKFLIMGELGLDGTVREVPGALPTVELAAKKRMTGCILPRRSALEASEYNIIDVYGVETMEEVLEILSGEVVREDLLAKNLRTSAKVEAGQGISGAMDFSEIIGQEGAKRGLEIAAAGNRRISAQNRITPL